MNFPWGGVERNIIDAGNYLSDNGFDVYVICETLYLNAYPVTKECKYKIIETGENSFKTPESMAYAIINSIKSRGLHLDVFICHVYNEYFKIIKQELNCKFIYTLQCMPFSGVRSWLERKKNKKGLINQCNYFVCRLFVKNRHLTKITNRERTIYDFSDIYTCLCDSYKLELTKAMRLPKDDSKIRVIYNFVDATNEFSHCQREKIILYVGRLFYTDKRVDRLLRIWKKTQNILSEWQMIIAGDGPDRGNLENLSEELNLKRISFLGWINDSMKLMKRASILCLTSESEGWPLVLMEAQSMGLPVVAFDCSAGVHEILSPNGTNGILVPHRNEKKFAKELIELANHADKRGEIAYNAFNAVKRFNIEKSGERWLEIVSQLKELPD